MKWAVRMKRSFLVQVGFSILLYLALCGCSPDKHTPDPNGEGGAGGDSQDGGECKRDADCDDDVYCNGAEQCEALECQAGTPRCREGQDCDEEQRSCQTNCALGADADDDGFDAVECGGSDCDDSNPDRFPGNIERCDNEGLDDDCDPTTLAGDEGDEDEDGTVSAQCCNSIDAALVCGTDCDDTRAGRTPEATEICNGIDDNCNGLLDHPAEDNDGDLHADVLCAGQLGTDCDDTDPRIYFDAREICDGRDDDCKLDGILSLTSSAEPGEDDDGDGHVALQSSCIEDPLGLPKDDCDDSVATTFTGAQERCNGIDDDCDGVVDNVPDSDLARSACASAQLAAGGNHTCIIRPDRTVVCWGDNVSGQLGDTGAEVDEAVLVPSIDDAVHIEAGVETTCVLSANNRLTCWGWDGVLGARVAQTFPAVGGGFGQIETLSGIIDFSLAGHHACAIVDGQAYCWGDNCQGYASGVVDPDACTPGVAIAPTAIPGVTSAIQIDSGSMMNCAVNAQHTVQCWGPNYVGMLGGGTTEPGVVTVTDLRDVEQVAVGGSFACARKRDGDVVCWGASDSGQLGCGSSLGCLSDGSIALSPLPVAGLSDVVRLEAGGGSHACALTQAGELYCWGNNLYGQLGNNAWNGPGTTGGDNQGAPVQVAIDEEVIDFSVGNEHTCATTATDTYCWGRSDQRQLGDGRTVPHPLDVPSRPATVSSIVGAVDVNVGYGDSCFVRHDGTVRCAGYDTWGEIAPAGSAYRSFLCPAYERDDLIQVATSINYGCRISVAGELACASRYLGSAIEGPGATDARQVAVGQEAACVVRADATVACMGRNRSGQLGVDLNPESSSLLYAVPGLSQVHEVAAGIVHFCARTEDKVFCWGDGREGQLGSVRVDRAPTPRAVLDLPGPAADIDAHGHTSCAVLTSGEVYCWGAALGPWPGGFTPQLITGYTGRARQVTVGGAHACVRTDSGGVYCWGSGEHGQLGNGGTASSATPLAVSGLRQAWSVDCGEGTCCAVRGSGQPVCWGQADPSLANGEDPSVSDQLTPRMALSLDL